MTAEHHDIAVEAFRLSEMPPPPRAVADAFRYVTKLLGMLPRNEQAGYTKGPTGGENTILLPNGILIRVSRICYPDGQMYKIQSDAPNGGPQWVADDVRPDLYVPFTSPIVTDPINERVDKLEKLVEVYHQRMEAINARFDADAVMKPLPEYEANIFGIKIVSRPKE